MTEPGQDWEAATFDGARRVQRRAVAEAAASRRLAWLEEALQLAAASGALALVRAERQRHSDAMWADG